MRTTKLVLVVVMVTALAGQVVFPVSADSPKPGENLLQDPSFEEYWHWSTWEYSIVVRDRGKGHPVNGDQSFGTPYFGTSESKWDKERPRQDEGGAGEVSGDAYWKFRAGYYQTVDAPPGARIRFSVWVNGFCEDEHLARCPVILKAGIDSTGGYDWQSSSVHWVATEIANQKYAQLTIEATVGPGGYVTVFTWGEPTLPMLYTAAYFDEASLVVVPAATATSAVRVASPVAPAVASASAAVPQVMPASVTQSQVSGCTYSCHRPPPR